MPLQGMFKEYSPNSVCTRLLLLISVIIYRCIALCCKAKLHYSYITCHNIWHDCFNFDTFIWFIAKESNYMLACWLPKVAMDLLNCSQTQQVMSPFNNMCMDTTQEQQTLKLIYWLKPSMPLYSACQERFYKFPVLAYYSNIF